ncbi:MAG: hypothetical protein ABJC66_01075 [Gammaproteobacteria bacterium]
MNIRVALFVALTVLVSCAARPRPDSGEFFDERSGNTLSVVAKPLVFARERSDVAAHARDYATLVAIDLDRSGEYSQYLLLYRWSTVDPRMSPPPAPEAGALRLLADGRSIDLKPLDRLPIGMDERSNLHMPDHGDAVTRAYRVDSALLHFIAASHEMTLRMPQESFDTSFTIWQDGRAALLHFLQRTVTP